MRFTQRSTNTFPVLQPRWKNPPAGLCLRLRAWSSLLNAPIRDGRVCVWEKRADLDSERAWLGQSARVKGLFNRARRAKSEQRKNSAGDQEREPLLLKIQQVNTEHRQCRQRWAISMTDLRVPHHRLQTRFHFLYLAFGIHAIVSLFSCVALVKFSLR